MNKPNKQSEFEAGAEKFSDSLPTYDDIFEGGGRPCSWEEETKKYLLERLRVLDAPGITIGIALLIYPREGEQVRVLELLDDAFSALQRKATDVESCEWMSIHDPEEVAALAALIKRERCMGGEGGAGS